MRDLGILLAGLGVFVGAGAYAYLAEYETAKPHVVVSPVELSSVPVPQGLTGAPGAYQIDIPEGRFVCPVMLRKSGLTDGSLLFDGAVPDPVDAYAQRAGNVTVILCRPAMGPTAGEVVVRVWDNGTLVSEYLQGEYQATALQGAYQPVGPWETY